MSTMLLLLLGCTPEIREVERRQSALASEIETLEAEVARLEADLREAGVKVRGRGRSGGRSPRANRGTNRRRGPAEGATDVSDDLGLAFSRSGEAPTIPTPPFEATGEPCAYKALLPDLKRISDFQLSQRGLGKASPLRVRVGGTELVGHAFPKQFNACTGAFRHAGTVVLFSTPSPGEPDELVLSFDPAFPSMRPDGRELFWLHPGQTATLTTTEPWDEAWGEALLTLTADAGRPPEVQIDGEEGGAGPLPGEGPWTITIEAVDHTLLEEVRIGSATHAASPTGKLR